MDNFGIDQNALLLISIITNLVLFIFFVIILIVVVKFTNKYKAFTNGASPENIEQLIIGIQQKLNEHSLNQNNMNSTIHLIQNSLRSMKSKVGIHRYNPFFNSGNKNSFSLAIIDDLGFGVVITSLYNGENSFIYAKSIQASKSETAISKEEQIAIELATKNKIPD